MTVLFVASMKDSETEVVHVFLQGISLNGEDHHEASNCSEAVAIVREGRCKGMGFERNCLTNQI